MCARTSFLPWSAPTPRDTLARAWTLPRLVCQVSYTAGVTTADGSSCVVMTMSTGTRNRTRSRRCVRPHRTARASVPARVLSPMIPMILIAVEPISPIASTAPTAAFTARPYPTATRGGRNLLAAAGRVPSGPSSHWFSSSAATGHGSRRQPASGRGSADPVTLSVRRA